MHKKVLVALDQGTTSSRAVVFDLEGHILSQYAEEFPQIYPHPGWVEHDPNMILQTQTGALQKAVKRAQVEPEDIAAIGITNQRETTLLWDRQTGRCVSNAIVWQCRRTAPMVDKLVSEGWADAIREKTGLVPDAYFSGTKLRWLLDELKLQEQAEKGNLCFGTIDSFLVWHLVSGHPHVTDATNAGRTMLFNIHTLEWDEKLLKIFNVPRKVLPKIMDSSELYGYTDETVFGGIVPIAGVAGDQQAALFGQCCFNEGEAKNTYGTGCFLLMNTGDKIVNSKHGLLTTVAVGMNGKATYALEGSVFVAGAAVKWLRDEMRLIDSADETEKLAFSVEDSNGVYVVPAFTGLGAPYWDAYARGAVFGLSRGTSKAHFVRAALESLAYQSMDVIKAMEEDSGIGLESLRVDGGASANNFLMQFQADILDSEILRPKVIETTALGAAYLAGIAVGYYKDTSEIKDNWQMDRTFYPQLTDEARKTLYEGWKQAVVRIRTNL